jgi:hypothetical protein
MSQLGWGEGGAAWAWRRQLWAWEEELLGEFRSVLANSVLQPDVIDRWVWRYDPNGGYSVRGAYQLLTATDVQDTTTTSYLIWHKQVPLKVLVMTWRLFRNRLPTKDNLVRRHIIPPDAGLYVTGCGGVETAHHLFLSCLVFAPLWSLVRSWIGISSVDPLVLHDHFLQFTYSADGSRARRFFMQMLWLCCIWVVWHERNNRIFKAKESTVLQLLERVKVHPLWWMKVYNVNI